MLVKILIPVGFILFLIYYFLYKETLMFFYSNNCSHCINFKPQWEQIKDQVDLTKEINCDVNKELCNNYNISAFPSILKVGLFGNVKNYTGKRSVDNIINFYQFD